jgi:hypothetical protein
MLMLAYFTITNRTFLLFYPPCSLCPLWQKNIPIAKKWPEKSGHHWVILFLSTFVFRGWVTGKTVDSEQPYFYIVHMHKIKIRVYIMRLVCALENARWPLLTIYFAAYTQRPCLLGNKNIIPIAVMFMLLSEAHC